MGVATGVMGAGVVKMDDAERRALIDDLKDQWTVHEIACFHLLLLLLLLLVLLNVHASQPMLPHGKRLPHFTHAPLF